MARKRQIDPGIWTSEQFCALGIEARLLFIGMITQADDEGRLKGGAQYLKMAIFPGDVYTADKVRKWRDEVINNQLVVLYNHDGNEYLCLPNFTKYQYMTKRFESKLPPPPEPNQLSTSYQPVNNELHGIGIGNGIDIGDGGMGEEEEKQPNVDYQQVIEIYNELCPSLPKAKELNDRRRAAIRARAKGRLDYIDTFKEVFSKAEASDFLTRRKRPPGDRHENWRPNLDWLLNESNMTKVLEGSYDNKVQKEDSDLWRVR